MSRRNLRQMPNCRTRTVQSIRRAPVGVAPGICPPPKPMPPASGYALLAEVEQSEILPGDWIFVMLSQVTQIVSVVEVFDPLGIMSEISCNRRG